MPEPTEKVNGETGETLTLFQQGYDCVCSCPEVGHCRQSLKQRCEILPSHVDEKDIRGIAGSSWYRDKTHLVHECHAALSAKFSMAGKSHLATNSGCMRKGLEV